MPKVMFTSSTGETQTVEVEDGLSVMRAAVLNSVDGSLPEMSEDEDEMLFCAAAERRDESRLGCQLTAGRDFASLSVRIPESQV